MSESAAVDDRTVRVGAAAGSPVARIGVTALPAVLLVVWLGARCPLGLDGSAADSWSSTARVPAGAAALRPLGALLSRAAQWLPLADAATRMALVNLALLGLGAWLLTLAVRRLEGADAPSWLGAAVGAALLVGPRAGATDEAASQAAALMLAVLLCAPGGEAPAPGAVAVAGPRLLALLVAGLGLGLGAPGWLLPAALLSLSAAWALRRGQTWPLRAPLSLSLGALVLLAAAVAGSAHGLATPGGPRLVGLMAADSLALAPVGDWLPRAGAIEERCGVPALLAAALGLWLLLRARRLLALVFAGALVAELVLRHGGDEPVLRGVSQAAVALCAALGIAALGRALGGPAGATAAGNGDRPLARFGALAVALGAGAIAVAAAWLAAPPRGWAPHPSLGGWTRAALREAPSRALVVARVGGLGPALRYAQEAEGDRPDVTVLARDDLDDARALAAAVRRGGGLALSADELAAWQQRSPAARQRDAGWLVERATARALGPRAVLWEAPSSDEQLGGDGPRGASLRAAVPLLRLDLVPLPPVPAPTLVARAEALAGRDGDPLLRRLLADVLTAIGDDWLGRDTRRAASLYEAALRSRPEAARTTLRLAETLARRDLPERARSLAARIAARHPDRLDARLAEARYALLAGDLDGAEAAYRTAGAMAPRAAAPRSGLARVAHARSQPDTARRFVDDALALDPADGEARALAREYGLR